MPENNKTQEFLKKLAPCIERDELDGCVEEAARLAKEMGIDPHYLFYLATQSWDNGKHGFAYVFALAAAQGLGGNQKVEAYFDAGIAAESIGKMEKAEEFYKKAIEINPKDADVHNNYANLLSQQNKQELAEEHYIKAIEANPMHVEARSNYAILLTRDRKGEAEKQFRKAIEVNPKYANAHGAYGLLLVEFDRREDAWKETELASSFFKETGNFTESHLAKARFYQRYSGKNLNRKKYRESSEDAFKAGEEYLNAGKTAEDKLRDDLTLQGNVLKAKSFVRKIPGETWYKKLYYRFGKNSYIPELIENLKNASEYYEKASVCQVGERQDVCNACKSAVAVFSEVLNAMSVFMSGDSAEISKDEWSSLLENARQIYIKKNLDNGTALIDTLNQLIKCVDKLAEHRKVGLKIQEERLGKCYNNLIEVSEKLDGALKIISEHAAEAIREYAKKRRMGFIEDEKPKKSIIDNWLIKGLIGAIITIFLGIISGIIANRFFGYTWILDKLSSIESVYRGFFNP